MKKDLFRAQKEKQGKGEVSESSELNVAKSDGNDSDFSGFLFSIIPSVFYSDASEWILDMEATYHICPRRKYFFSFEKQNSRVLIMRDDGACQMNGIDTVRIKMFDGMVRD